MKKIVSVFAMSLVLCSLLCAFGLPVAAAETEYVPTSNTEQISEAAEEDSSSSKAWSAALVVGIAGAAGAIAMGLAIAKSVEGISRQPEADGKIRSSLMLGIVFIETVVIYALIVAILIIFVL